MTANVGFENMKDIQEHPLIGRWHSPEWSSVEITIKPLKTTFQIKAVDLDDGERFQIKNKNWDEKIISFDLFTPSTGHTCRHVLTYKGRGKAYFQITWSEEWILKRNKKKPARPCSVRR